MTRLLGLALAIAMLTAPTARAARAISGPFVVRPATFSTLPSGWRHFDDGFGVLGRQGTNVFSFATSWGYRLASYGGPAGNLPPNGIFVSVNLLRTQLGRMRLNLCRQTPHLAGYPLVRSLPLRLPRATSSTLEGSPGIPEYRVFGRIGESYNFELRVDVRNPRPPARLLAEAQRVVDAIRFPSWPRRGGC